MIRFFYRLPNLVQFLTFMSLILIAGLLLAWRMLITVVNNQALHSAQDAADFVEAIGDVASSYNGIWVHYNPKKVVKIGDFLDHQDLRPHPAVGESAASSPVAKLAARTSVDVIPIKAVGYQAASVSDGEEPKSDTSDASADLSNLYSSQAVNFNTVGLSKQQIENLVRFGGYMRKNPALFQREVSDAGALSSDLRQASQPEQHAQSVRTHGHGSPPRQRGEDCHRVLGNQGWAATLRPKSHGQSRMHVLS
jgi:hypothetical protein